MADIKELKSLTKGLSLLYVEDEPHLRESVEIYLKKIFDSVTAATNGAEGLEAYRKAQFDLVLTDIQMPVMNGLEMIKEIKSINSEQEVIIISAYSEPDYFMEAIRMGVNGYIIKPVDFTQMNQILYQSVLKLKRFHENLNYKMHLEEMVQSRTEEVISLEEEKVENFEMTLQSFITMIEDRDTYTGGHSQRVANYCRLIAERMEFSYEECELIYRAGIMHDIGKISTPDSILLKPGHLTDIEYKLIKEHVSVGYDLLSKVPMYKELAKLIIYHHERFDGTGYPYGLKGNEIPPLARIMIVADAFDAMTTNRIYQGRKDVPSAIMELRDMAGSQFHPEVVEVAADVLSKVEGLGSTDQTPQTELEQERFAYFYRDQVTHAYNVQYLNFILNRNFHNREYECINALYLHHFSQYNQDYGWSQGDILLQKFVDHLYDFYPNSLIFRLHGDDFILLSKKHLEIDIKQLSFLPLLSENRLSISRQHIDLRETSIQGVNELEKLICQE